MKPTITRYVLMMGLFTLFAINILFAGILDILKSPDQLMEEGKYEEAKAQFIKRAENVVCYDYNSWNEAINRKIEYLEKAIECDQKLNPKDQDLSWQKKVFCEIENCGKEKYSVNGVSLVESFDIITRHAMGIIDFPNKSKWAEALSAYQEDFERVLNAIDDSQMEAVREAYIPVQATIEELTEVKYTKDYKAQLAPFQEEFVAVATPFRQMLTELHVSDTVKYGSNLSQKNAEAVKRAQQANGSTTSSRAVSGSVVNGKSSDAKVSFDQFGE